MKNIHVGMGLLLLTLGLASAPAHAGCQDEFTNRRIQLVRKAWIITPLAVVAVPAAAYAGGYIGAATFVASGLTGWTGLAAAIGWIAFGTEVGAGVGLLGYTATEVGAVVQAVRARHMEEVLEEAIRGTAGEHTQKFVRRYLDRFPKDASSVNEDQVVKILNDWNQSERLCDGSMKRTIPTRARDLVRLKHRVPTLPELRAAIHAHVTN